MQANEFMSHGIPVTQVQVETEQDMKELNRTRGRYITLDTGPLAYLVDFEGACACLAEQLKPLLEPYFGKSLCVCGMGNPTIPSDCLGPETAKRFPPKIYRSFVEKSNFERIAVICPGTSAQTNIATESIVSGVVSAMGAACVLVVDSCVTADTERLCSTIQLADSGIRNHHQTAHLCQSTVGVPVISIVVPTAICLPDDNGTAKKAILAPINVTETVSIAAFIIACAVTQLAYPELDYESCKQYIGLFLYGVI